MKKKVLIIALIILFFHILGTLSEYKMDGVIIDHDTIEDTTGNVWEYDTNGFRIGDKVEITFVDRGPTTRVDDIIKGIELIER